MGALPLLGVNRKLLTTTQEFPLGTLAYDSSDPRNLLIYVKTATDIDASSVVVAVKLGASYVVSAAVSAELVFGFLRDVDTEDTTTRYAWCQIGGLVDIDGAACDATTAAGTYYNRTLVAGVVTAYATTDGREDFWAIGIENGQIFIL